MPIDRYYIEKFLSQNSEHIKGRVLEIGDNYYTKKFGGDKVIKSDILHINPNDKNATIVGDLEKDNIYKEESFDCIIITQTLQLIFNINIAISNIYNMLRKNGIVLATVPGISQTYDKEWHNKWYWNFTSNSIKRLFEEVFNENNIKIQSNGNLLSAVSFLYGLAASELSHDILDHTEPGYEVSIQVRAKK